MDDALFDSFSLNKCSHINSKIKKTLQAQFVTKSYAYTDKQSNHKSSKRVSSIFFTLTKAGVTVEAAIAIPIFLFFVANLISLINIFNTYGEKLSQSQQIARSQAYMCCVAEGSGEDIVTGILSFSVSPFFEEIGFNSTASVAVMKYRKWTGYDLASTNNESEQEEYVYITDYGSCYHRNQGCKYINVSIEVVSVNSIGGSRNKNGEKYYPCEKCGGNSTGILFITPEGNRYHSNSNCSALKRGIKRVKLSDVEGRSPCSNCGG